MEDLTSRLFLEGEGGVRISANVPNARRAAGTRLAVGDVLWLSRDAADTLVLTE